ncbi:hypothetical protein B9Z19DRAFT_1123770 [Tuber borchii]|uniref:Uncharacterized protein n=1 Tax=Tuber borchii TaxID=42251 RepID=A0A2T6ZXQ8_TUBBO|nr:hypothetical protein B9Z19DRAFT_1123770 [Tuber borchii]
MPIGRLTVATLIVSVVALLQTHRQEAEATRLARSDFDWCMRAPPAADIRDCHERELAELQALRAASKAPCKKRRGWYLRRRKGEERRGEEK